VHFDAHRAKKPFENTSRLRLRQPSASRCDSSIIPKYQPGKGWLRFEGVVQKVMRWLRQAVG
jgi:hypothetical protein